MIIKWIYENLYCVMRIILNELYLFIENELKVFDFCVIFLGSCY